ncbi:MAG TPA: hypothetical protein VF094_03760 [Gaiellaceae bacterium]
MSRTRNAYVFAVAVLAALVAVPFAAATTRPPVQSVQAKQAVRALVLRGQALDRIYHLGSSASSTAQAIHALKLRGQALNRFYHLGSSTKVVADATLMRL